ncbi:TonB-dependent receptor [Synechococcales cyanobacterium C]|uniref:TonB-dependent receptor n=1 Tax=Petrachloros mirabilis ULC683 TaxID=2781853 RepID=A0A8K2AA23_9CYAN|nr:TonB-dependent receptor [Petrachloros mirabilis ULC683]
MTHNILQFSETEQPVTSVEAWMTQVGQSLIRVTGVQVNPTETGLELVLQTDQGDLTVPTPVTVGNALIADIPNAILALPDGNEFQQYSPINGIALVTVTSYAENQVRVAITGLNAPPTAEIRTDAQQLILSLSPSSETEDEAAADEAQDSISIVVTAQKTPEDIQDVPLSVTVLTEQEIEDADITSLEEIARNVPNFSFFPSGDRSFAIYSVRGLSNSSVIASRDPVDFYIDGVPYGFASFLDVDLPELERVEVLRGPQSVLYGRNSLAGVVNLITRRPSDVLEFSGIVGYGSYNDLDLRASVSGPLIEEQLFFRLSGNYGSRDGYLRNTFLDTDVNERSGGTGRAQLLWIPSEDWEIALNASFEAYRDGASAYVPLGQSNPFETEQDVDGFNALVTNAQSLQISYNHSDFRFASITAHRFSQNDLEFDGDYTTADAVVRVLDELSTSIFSQEFRLQSPETAEHFEWLLGGYYESSQFHSVDNGFRFGNDATTLLGVPFPAGTLNLSNSGVSANTLAVFGQISYRPIDALTLTTGLRYESTTSRLESFERTLRIPGPPDLSLLSLRNIEQDGDALLPRFVIEYRFNPDMMTYGSITRGYRPPGTNFGAGSVETATYGAERSWNYEVGFKSSWLNNRLAVNLALFHNPVENFQVLSFDELGGSFTDNANVRISGLELEARATPTTGFDIIAGLGIVDARFTDFTNRFTGEDSAGNRLTFAPNITYNLAIQYRNPIGIFGRVELQGLGTTYFDDANFLKQDPYAIINARLGYERDNFGIYLFANNIFNTEYINQAFSLPPIGSIASYGTPATYGVQVRSRF